MENSNLLRCSVIIVSYNRSKLLCETVFHLSPLVADAGEIIVVDQCAPKEVADSLKLISNVRYFNLHKPGMTAARNFGILKAKHEIILFVDDDVEPSSNLIKGHILSYQDSKVGGVAGRIIEQQQKDVALCIDPRALDPINGWRYTHFDHLESVEVMTARGCNMSFRKDLLLEIGGFDIHFKPPFSFREDSDVCFRIREIGYQIISEPTAELLHLSASSGGTRATNTKRSLLLKEYTMYRLHFFHYRDNLFFLSKHFLGIDFWRNVLCAYRDYVGISRYPWRLLAKNLCFVVALLQASYMARTYKPPYFEPD